VPNLADELAIIVAAERKLNSAAGMLAQEKAGGQDGGVPGRADAARYLAREALRLLQRFAIPEQD
jgi:hypothetical protein